MKTLLKSYQALITGETNFIATLANTAAFIYQNIPDLNWAGFYFLDTAHPLKTTQQLVLGPFQGKIACTRIPVGQGVCGSSFLKQETIIVADVHQFDGHIACDSASNSEIVVPLYKNNQLIGVLDVDSPLFNRFGRDEALFFEAITQILNYHFDALNQNEGIRSH